MSLKKEDFIFIGYVRCVRHSQKELWKMKIDELQDYIGTISSSEYTALEEQKKKREQLIKDLSISNLNEAKKIAKGMNADIESTMTKGGLLDAILAKGTPVDFALDDDQKKVVANHDNMVIDAGPGSGKTTTLCYLISSILTKNPGAHIIVLAFNRIAEAIIKRRLSIIGISPIPKTKIGENGPGVAILTFDKLAHQISNSGNVDEYEDFFNSDACEFSMTYMKNMQDAIRTCMNGKYLLSWNYVIVDEAQDVKDDHLMLIKYICNPSTKLIVAGDPRQEVYQGSGWFSKQCIESRNKFNLRYNHRSEPAIVDLLNKFSEKCFPSLHVGQIAARAQSVDREIPFITHVPLANASCIGEAIGHVLTQFPPNNVCTIAPVTVRKYGLDAVIPNIKDIIANFSYGSCVSVLDEPKTTIGCKGIYDIGTSLRLKGSEREVIVIYGFEKDFHMIDKPSLYKRMYVALSRATTHLVLVYDKFETGHLMNVVAPLIFKMPIFRHSIIDELMEIEQTTKRRPPPFIQYKAAIDFDGYYRHFSFPIIETKKKVNAIAVPIPITSPILNKFVVDKIAVSLGVTLPKITNIKTGATKFSINGDEFMLRSKPFNLDEIFDLWNDDTSSVDMYTICRHALESGVIESINHEYHDVDVQPIVSLIKEEFDSKGYSIEEIKYLPNISRNLEMFRSPEDSGHINITIDFTIGGIPVIVSHGEITDVAKEKLTIAIACCKVEHGLVINTKNGELTWVYGREWSYLNSLIRAKLAINYAHIRFVNYFTDKRIDPPRQLENVIIVDVETSDKNMLITEIAAIAFNVSTRNVVDVYHSIANGIVNATPGDNLTMIEDMTKLKCKNATELRYDQKNMVSNFQTWAKNVFANPVIINWGGSEQALLGGSGLETVDAMHGIYKVWLDRNGMGRNSLYSLGIAKEQFIYDLPVAPHRAMEDVIMTAAVLVCMISTVTLL